MRLVSLLTLLLLGFGSSSAQPALHLVTRIVDGDTIDVERIGRIRLIGVDTPETVDPRRPVQYFGREASDFLKKLARGKRVRLEYDQQPKDAYGRTLAYVYLADGTFVNAEIIRQGYGFAYTRFPFRRLEEFRALEREAREAERGLWAPERAAPRAVSAPTADAERAASPKGLTVYVTRTGTKYHARGCRHLARSQIPIELTEAANRYGPCAVCRPPAAR